tara:strand:- start:65 stop:337 length:273 start_codon:yes stop_codon:yes gene_type:complete
MAPIVSKDDRIDLKHLEEDALMQDLNWSIARFEQVETLVRDMIAELKRCYEELDRPKVTIDDWDKAGPCVTVYLEGKEYVGILREYNASE